MEYSIFAALIPDFSPLLEYKEFQADHFVILNEVEFISKLGIHTVLPFEVTTVWDQINSGKYYESDNAIYIQSSNYLCLIDKNKTNAVIDGLNAINDDQICYFDGITTDLGFTSHNKISAYWLQQGITKLNVKARIFYPSK